MPAQAGLESRLGNCGLRRVWLGHRRSCSSSQATRQDGLSWAHLSSVQAAGSRGAQGSGEANSAHQGCQSTLLVSSLGFENSMEGPQKYAHLYKYISRGIYAARTRGKAARLEAQGREQKESGSVLSLLSSIEM